MLYRDAFRKLARNRGTLACMIIVGVCAVFALMSAIDSISEKGGGAPFFFESQGTTFKEPDPVTGLDRSYHAPTVMLALGVRGVLEDKYVKALDATTEAELMKLADSDPLKLADLKNVQAKVRQLEDDGIFSSNAWHLPCGADQHGRDVLHMTIHGLRWAFIIGIVTTAISVVIGVVLGSLAGYFGGWVDDLIVWIYTTLASIPFLLLLIAIMGMVSNEQKEALGLWIMLIVIGLVVWVGLARLIRAEFMKHKQREYVQACRALGYGHMRIIFRHILPNVIHVAIITFTLSFVSSINIEVFLTFVGVGAGALEPTWGRMISDAKTELTRDPSVWWPLTSATVFLFVLSLAFSIFGDALRDALDPKLRTGS